MAYLDFLSPVHRATRRDYLARVNEYPKAQAARQAKRWGVEYWDGDRRTGYGGYRYDGRWRSVADALRDHYGLVAGRRVLDVGCGKGFLLHDLTQSVPGLEVAGVDISEYAVAHAKPEVQHRLCVGDAARLPYPDGVFDLVISINTLHNLGCAALERALREIERVARPVERGGARYVCVESYRSEEEKVNLMYWQLTCEQFCSPEDWAWWFDRCGYRGDHSFIYFE
jgi:protein-L-isoaspartate(D-aspartate) O-methyltransferase